MPLFAAFGDPSAIIVDPDTGATLARAGSWAILLAAVPMLSAYVGFALAAGLLGVALVDAARAPERWRALAHWATVGLLAAALAAPLASAYAGSGGGRLAPALSAAGSWHNGALFTLLLGDGPTARLLDTPALLLVEFGLVGLLGLAGVRRALRLRRSRRAAAAVLVFLAVTVLLCVLLRPPVGGPNNLYARGLLPAWLLSCPYAALAFARWRARARRALFLALAVCLAGTAYAWVGVLAEGSVFWPTPPALVRTARLLDRTTPVAARFATPPDARPPQLAYWLRRGVVYYDRRHALLFGATPAQVDAVESLLRAAFTAPAADAAALFYRAGATHLLARRDRLPPSWLSSVCFRRVAGEGDWIALALACR